MAAPAYFCMLAPKQNTALVRRAVRVIECWRITDEFSLLQQLGMTLHQNAQDNKEVSMILVRIVCQAKFGMANEVVAGFKQSAEIVRTLVGSNVRSRLLTDLSGSFDTVVQELEVKSLAEWERLRALIFASPDVQAAEATLPDMIVSGQTEYYTIEGTY
jgi:hypothetical protein